MKANKQYVEGRTLGYAQYVSKFWLKDQHVMKTLELFQMFNIQNSGMHVLLLVYLRMTEYIEALREAND
ncbi:hypothetical protein Lal_00016932 [Lupinus albus]|nr:hypothetical protein Lal_00016932 [Lupinus albus]